MTSARRGCLGKRPARHDVRTFRLASVLDRSVLTAPPPARNWDEHLPSSLPMWKNDRIGDCAVAALAGMVMGWTSLHGPRAQAVSDEDVLAMYSAISGYRADDKSTDRGADMLAAMAYMRRYGLGGHKIGAFVKVEHRDREEVKIAINLFGSVYTGVNLPVAAQRIGTWVGPADLTGINAPDSWGGHAMGVGHYDHSGVVFKTWGGYQPADWAWWGDYVEEAYGIISPDWVDGTTPAPNGLDIDKVRAELAAL